MPSSAGQTPLYDADDLLLYASSPFAFWMERRRLQAGPGQGPEPDPGAAPPVSSVFSQAELREQLEGSVVVIERGQPEPQRRQATLQALRAGIDWVIDGQLADRGFSMPCNLLRRDSEGASEGQPRYLPCVTQPLARGEARVHLCLAAELLTGIFGEPPGQLLLMRGSQLQQAWLTAEWLPLFQGFLRRFLADQAAFDPASPPDPTRSLSYGRWHEEARRQAQGRSEASPSEEPVAAAVVALTSESGGDPDPQVTQDPQDLPVPQVSEVSEVPEVSLPASPVPWPAAANPVKGHPLDTPGFNILETRSRQRDKGQPARTASPLSPVLNTRDSADD